MPSSLAKQLHVKLSKPYLPYAALQKAGVTLQSCKTPSLDTKVTLVQLHTENKEMEYWAGFNNFYVITRYNRSYNYAMAVYELSQRLQKGML